MEEIPLVCGKWKFLNRWVFLVDSKRGCRVLYVKRRMPYDDFVGMVYEDFILDSRKHVVHLSYKLSRKGFSEAEDTPPVFVCNGRQLEGFIRQCKTDSVRRLCVEIEEKSTKTERENVEVMMEGEQSYKRKSCGKEPMIGSAVNVSGDIEDEGNGDDEEESYRFECCDDSDGASEGDEEIGLPSNFLREEIMDDEEVRCESSNEVKGDAVRIKAVGTSSQVMDMSDCDIEVGDKYDTNDQLETRLRILSVYKKFDFVIDRSRPNLYVVKCWIPGCQWRLRASTIGDSPILHIRIYERRHSCSVLERSARGRKATPDVLGELYKGYVGGVGEGVVPNHVGAALNLRYGVKDQYWKSHRTLRCARELVRGTYEKGYEELPGYLYKIRRANPGTLTRLEVDEFDRFKAVFIAFGASIEGFTFMRKVIIVDGTFLKGKYLGTLLIATTQDGNYNIFPLAFVVVDTENDESWEWFFRQLCIVIPDDEGLAIISDRHKSIGKAIGRVFPLASRGICTYHLHKNIMLKFKGSETFTMVKQAATAYREHDFNVVFQQIEELNPGLHQYLLRADVTKWSRVHFPGDRYNFTTSNIAESVNKVLKAARHYPIVRLLDEIRLMLTRWFAARRIQADIMTTVLTKGVEKVLAGRVDRASKLFVQQIDRHHYEVRSGSSMNVVNLSQRMCSCRMFDLDKLTCIHAIAAAEKANICRISKCHPYYRTEYLRKGYAKSVMPIDKVC